MRAQWEREKEQAEGHGKLRERLDAARVELERAERELDYQRAAELRHGEIPELEQQARRGRGARRRRDVEPPVYLSERVDADEIAEVVAQVDRHPGLAACSRARSRSSSTWRSGCTSG